MTIILEFLISIPEMISSNFFPLSCHMAKFISAMADTSAAYENLCAAGSLWGSMSERKHNGKSKVAKINFPLLLSYAKLSIPII